MFPEGASLLLQGQRAKVGWWCHGSQLVFQYPLWDQNFHWFSLLATREQHSCKMIYIVYLYLYPIKYWVEGVLKHIIKGTVSTDKKTQTHLVVFWIELQIKMIPSLSNFCQPLSCIKFLSELANSNMVLVIWICMFLPWCDAVLSIL